MYQDLPQGVKNSITRSIKTAFELYMYGIKWDPALYNMDDFMITWKNSFENGASWYTRIDADAKKDPAFHSALAEKVNQVIEKILTEAVTETQKKNWKNVLVLHLPRRFPVIWKPNIIWKTPFNKKLQCIMI